MIYVYVTAVVMVSINLGNSLESTINQSLSEERYNYFDAELIQVFTQKRNSNVLISPISIKLVLGMLIEGAEDRTASEIRAALRLPEEKEARRKEFSTWLSVLQANESGSILKVANRVFLSNRYSINPEYRKIITRYYSGGVTKVKFENAKEASDVINMWVGNQTSDLISSVIDETQISPDNKLMLASAVYFKGFWSSPFASERSAVRCFYSKVDKCEDSLMMVETGYFDYGHISRLDAKAILLPYKGGKFSMLLLLPSKRDGVELLSRDLVHVSLSSIISELKEEEVFVQIPEFEISFNDDLVESLKTVQISELFTPRASLSKMITNSLESISVSHFYHSAKITVNEEGSEAAAATGAMFVPLMGGTTTYFVANHPFLFFVMSPARNSVLFAGKVVSPKTPDESKKRKTNHHDQIGKKTKDRNFVTPPLSSSSSSSSSHKQDSSKMNASTDSAKTIGHSEKALHEVKPHQRGEPQVGPKFRSFKPPPGLSTFSLPRIHSNERKIPDGSPLHRAFPPYPETHLEKDTQNLKNKRGKTVQDVLKNRKRQDQAVEDWRHHILIFT